MAEIEEKVSIMPQRDTTINENEAASKTRLFTKERCRFQVELIRRWFAM